MHNISHFSRFGDVSCFAGSPVGFGGATSDSDLPWLKGQGFGTVINLRQAGEEGVDVEHSRAAAVLAGLRYIHLPFDSRVMDQSLIKRFLQAAGKDNNQPVYIHCGSATRVAALWAIGRVLKDGLALAAISDEVTAIAQHPEHALAYANAYLEAVQRGGAATCLRPADYE